MAKLTRITLDKCSDISKVERLHEHLESLLESSAGVEIDASAVERIDTSTLQLLASFVTTLAGHHQVVHFVNPSRYFSDTASLMGLSRHLHLTD